MPFRTNVDYINAEKSKCQDCANACGKCTWSNCFVPVVGWDATPTISHTGYGDINSYIVHSCPMFQADKKRHTEDIRIDKVRPLAFRILLSAIRDYARALTGRKDKYALYHPSIEIDQVERFFKEPIIDDMLDVCGISMDPDRILRAVRDDPVGTLYRIRTMMEGNAKDQYDEYTEEYYEQKGIE